MSQEFKRLADQVLNALNCALEQQDLEIAELLGHALEKSLTRLSGGKDFVERRDFTAEYSTALQKLHDLRSKN